MEALQRDILRKFSADVLHETEVDELWEVFVAASDAAWRLPDATSDPFGDELDKALEGCVDALQPRSVYVTLSLSLSLSYLSICLFYPVKSRILHDGKST